VRNKLLLGAAAVLGLTSVSGDVSAQSNIKAALLDMSAIVGVGTVGMVSPGTMGRGTMMGPGTMGPTEMGNAMTGMMGMMGVMAIRLDHNPVKAGDITFDATNWSRSTVHEIVVVKVDSQSSQLPFDYSQSKVREDQIKILGDTAELQPNESKSITVRLEAGTYMLFCNVPGHYAWGMATTLNVTQ
jgi:uncharacterized cupredoxin-like copper-binding protein